jgi:DNA-binding transcriptional MerR regulator
MLMSEGSKVNQRLQVREFAKRTGVTVRALHHYDRLKLLQPRRSPSGYRLYGDVELQKLEQIVALKFLGIPLRKIKSVLDRDTRTLPELLTAQRRALEEKRHRLEMAIKAIGDAEQEIRSGPDAHAAALTKIIEVIEMQENEEFFKKYYSDEAWAKVSEKRKQWDPSQQAEVTKQWTELFRDVEAAMAAGEDPQGENVQALAARWKKLVEGFTGGDLGIAQGVGKVWADQANWPAQMKEQAAPFGDKKVWQFMHQAMNCGK